MTNKEQLSNEPNLSKNLLNNSIGEEVKEIDKNPVKKSEFEPTVQAHQHNSSYYKSKWSSTDLNPSPLPTKVLPKKSIKEVISLGKNKLQNGAFRIMTPLGVCKKTLSTNIGAYFTDYIDIHNLNDYKKAKKKIEKN